MNRWSSHIAQVAMAVTLLGVAACRVTDLHLWNLPEPPAKEDCEVEQVRGVAYHEGPAADPVRHRLDLFLPKGRTAYPVVVLVHGGAWMVGDNRCCGLYSSVGEFLARQGIGAVIPNYRLSPGVKHPDHVKDVADAVAWTHRHIGEYGGDAGRLFLAGHSAGGHLVTLLATDEQYLKAVGLGSSDLKGVVGVSGVYDIPPGDVQVTLGGPPPAALHIEAIVPLRDASGPAKRTGLPGLPVSANVYGLVFGNDAQGRANASPVRHVRPGLPPVLLLTAEHDLPTLAPMADAFYQALQGQGCKAQVYRVPGRNHNSIMFRAVTTDDPVGRVIVAFVRLHGS